MISLKNQYWFSDIDCNQYRMLRVRGAKEARPETSHKATKWLSFQCGGCRGLLWSPWHTRQSAHNPLSGRHGDPVPYCAAEIVSDNGGAPSSRACADAFRRVWLNWAGPPRSVIVDRGLHNRGRFSELLMYHGVQIRFLELKPITNLAEASDTGASPKLSFNMLWKPDSLWDFEPELLLPEAVFIKNNRIRHGGFTPSHGRWESCLLRWTPWHRRTHSVFWKLIKRCWMVRQPSPGRCNYVKLQRKLAFSFMDAS